MLLMLLLQVGEWLCETVLTSVICTTRNVSDENTRPSPTHQFAQPYAEQDHFDHKSQKDNGCVLSNTHNNAITRSVDVELECWQLTCQFPTWRLPGVGQFLQWQCNITQHTFTASFLSFNTGCYCLWRR